METTTDPINPDQLDRSVARLPVKKKNNGWCTARRYRYAPFQGEQLFILKYYVRWKTLLKKT